MAVIAIIVAGIIDGLDGRIARLIGGIKSWKRIRLTYRCN